MGKRKKAGWQMGFGAAKKESSSDAAPPPKASEEQQSHGYFAKILFKRSDDSVPETLGGHTILHRMAGSSRVTKVMGRSVGRLRFKENSTGGEGETLNAQQHLSKEGFVPAEFGRSVFVSSPYGDVNYVLVKDSDHQLVDGIELVGKVEACAYLITQVGSSSPVSSWAIHADSANEQLLVPLIDSAILAQKNLGKAIEETTAKLQSLRNWAASCQTEATTSQQGGHA